MLSYYRIITLYRTEEVLERFIVLEGLDAAGKSTQSNNLSLRLRAAGFKTLQTSEPTNSPYGAAIRDILASTTIPQPHYLSLLYAADRALHLYHPPDNIIAFLKRGWVICSRYLFSSFAYQGEITDQATIASYNRHFPLPQYLIYLDIGAHISERRLKERQQPRDMFEHLEFLQRVQQRYSQILAHYATSGMQILSVDASQPPGVITEHIWNALDK